MSLISFKDAFWHKQCALTEKLDITSSGLLNHLVDAEVITKSHKMDCESKNSEHDRVYRLLDILDRRPDIYLPKFCECLVNTGQKHVVKLLNLPASIIEEYVGPASQGPVNSSRTYNTGSIPSASQLASSLYVQNPSASFSHHSSYQSSLYQSAELPPSQSNPPTSGAVSTTLGTTHGQTQRPVAGSTAETTTLHPLQAGTGNDINSTTGAAAAAATAAGGGDGYNALSLTTSPSVNSSSNYNSHQQNTNNRANDGGHVTAPAVMATSSEQSQQQAQGGGQAAAISLQTALSTRLIPDDVKVLKYEELQNVVKIADGSFGSIHRAMHSTFGTVVMKQLLASVLNPKDRNAREMQREAHAHTLRHKNIVSTLGVVFEPGHYAIVLEYAQHGGLDTFLQKCEVEFVMKMSLAQGIVDGMNYLHSLQPPVIHGYLRIQHVLLDSQFISKICDFGLSKWQQFATTKTQTRKDRGTVTHIPPENWMNVNLKRTTKFDVYSFSILLWQLATEKVPFGDASLNESVIKVSVVDNQRPLPEDVDEVNAQIATDFRTEVKRLIGDCWDHDPQKRPSFEALKVDFDKLMSDKEELLKTSRKHLEEELRAMEADGVL